MIENKESEGDSLALILLLPLHTTFMIIEDVKHTFSINKTIWKISSPFSNLPKL